MKDLFNRIIKGMIIGASMLIPGISGGTMAIVLNVYDELIHGVSDFRKNMRHNFLLLLQFLIGGCLGIVLLAQPMLAAITLYRMPMTFFFMGAILASVRPLYQKATIDKLKPRNILAALAGLAVSPLVTFLMQRFLVLDPETVQGNSPILLIAGFIVAVALILPGISGSYMLLLMGLYETTLTALIHLDLWYLLPFVIGGLAALILMAKVLAKAMDTHPQFTYMIIIGFVLGALAEVFPGLPEGGAIPLCLITFILGFFAVFLFTGAQRAQQGN